MSIEVLRPKDGGILTNGEAYSDRVYLSGLDSPENWPEQPLTGRILKMPGLYREFSAGQSYAAGDKLLYLGKLYKCIVAHVSQWDWTPDIVPSLFTRIEEQHEGTRDDPIPYSGNIVLEKGKYYCQDGALYRCTRDTEIPVFAALADLIGIYVIKEKAIV